MTRALGVLVLLGSLGGPLAGVAVAQPAAANRAAADRAAAEADALAKDGKFAAAAAKFREAWQADRLRPELFCNIGISYYKARDLVRAHLLLGQCLEQAALEPRFVDAARTALASVEGVLRGAGHAPVRIVVEPAASAVAITELDPDGRFLGSRVVWLPFGSYHIAARAEGYTEATEVVTTSSPEPKTVTITLQRPPASEPPAPPSPASAAERPARWPAYVATGALVIALGVTTVAYVEGHARADLGATALDSVTLEADREAVSSWNNILGIAGVAAVASAAASGYLWYRALHGAQVESRGSAAARSNAERRGGLIEVHATPGGAGVSLSGRF